jgi:hypothetical protein
VSHKNIHFGVLKGCIQIHCKYNNGPIPSRFEPEIVPSPILSLIDKPIILMLIDKMPEGIKDKIECDIDKIQDMATTWRTQGNRMLKNTCYHGTFHRTTTHGIHKVVHSTQRTVEVE